MKKILIIETAKVSDNTSIAHVRNSIILTKHLQKYFTCKLVDLTTKIDVTEQWDIILFSYAGLGCDFTIAERLINNQTDVKIGWITNEFELFANGFVKDHMTFMINNFEESGIKKAHRHDQLLTTNLNTLIHDIYPNEPCEKKYDVCYYGTYRKYREDYFKKYCVEDMILSSSKKNWKKFIDIGLDCMVCDKFTWTPNEESLNLFKASLYIEDSKTHTCFNYMANRFFEGLKCNTPSFFDRSCMNTIENDVYYIDNYFIIDSYEELMDKVNTLDERKVQNYLQANRTIAHTAQQKTIKDIVDFLEGL